jgi:uncharacterized damage-inducible protein DinB
MKARIVGGAGVFSGLLLITPLSGQDLPQALTESFMEVEGKVIALAQAIPETAYPWRPADGVRSVSEVLMHLVGANYGVLARVGAETPADVPETWHRIPESVTEKASVLEALRASFAFARTVLEGTPASTYGNPAPAAASGTSIISQLLLLDVHAHEHLGQLIAYSRINGIPPPWSR